MSILGRVPNRLLDVMAAFIIWPTARVLRHVRDTGIEHFPRSRAAFVKSGVFPITNHYYEPLFDPKHLRKPLDQPRALPGIDWNVDEQLATLAEMSFGAELSETPTEKRHEHEFAFNNGFFESGDAEFLYNMVRLKKPKRVIEIGSGNSTLLVANAIAKNRLDDSGYECEHECIEPFEMPWLDRLPGVKLYRQRVEEVPVERFSSLQANDILFIDSSHMVRPQGDVLFEFLEILPTLRSGVIVHVHDIFSPMDYPKSWIIDQVRFWNEQYILEAFLSGTSNWRIIGALNFLATNHFDALRKTCPFLTATRDPGSFWIQRR